MKGLLVLSLFLLFACAHDDASRDIASSESDDYLFGDIDFKKSSVRVYPEEKEDGKFHYYFFLQLKDSLDRFVDIEVSELVLKTKKGEVIPHTLDRSSRGKYYVTVESDAKLGHREVLFLFNNTQLKEQVSLKWDQPSKKHSTISQIRQGLQRRTFKLCLKNNKKQILTDPKGPEIIIDGYAEVEDLHQDPNRCWIFDVIYPDQNILFYISVRSHGAFFERMIRINHIEK